jgi:hypothetical protein
MARPASRRRILCIKHMFGYLLGGVRRVLVHEVLACDPSLAAVDSGIYCCAPSAASADVLLPVDAVNAAVYVHHLGQGTLPRVLHRCAAGYSSACNARAVCDGYWGAYGCPSEHPAVLTPAQSGAPVVDRSDPVWTVKVGPLGSTNEHFSPPITRTVTTAYFAGN